MFPDFQKTIPKVRAIKLRFMFLFQPGRICGAKGSPWSSGATSTNVFCDFEKFRSSRNEDKQHRTNTTYQGKARETLCASNKRQLLAQQSRLTHTHTCANTTIEPRRGGGVGRSCLHTRSGCCSSSCSSCFSSWKNNKFMGLGTLFKIQSAMYFYGRGWFQIAGCNFSSAAHEA